MSGSRKEQTSLLAEKNGVTITSAGRRGEVPEKQPYVPVRLTPAWEATNATEDELNFRNINMEDAHLQLNPPKDKLNLVLLVLLLHGVGVLMPWNMFITAKAYFVDYKLSENYTGISSKYATNFMPYLGFAAQVPNVIFNWVNIFVQLGGNLTTRIVWSITIEVIIFIFTIILAMSDSQDWPGTFFWVTLGCVVILNMANGVYQNTVYGMAAKLPFKYTGIVVLGSNISGTFTAVISILSEIFASNARTAAIYYFITALFVLLLCFDTYFALPLNRFYRHHELKNLKEAQLKQRETPGVKPQVPYWIVFKQAFPQLFNVFMVFFVTLSVFPEIHSNIKPSDSHFVVTDKYYTSVTCFLTFNVCAMLGSSISSWFTWPKPKYLWIPVMLRLLYIPLFLLCNYQPAKVDRIFPVLINNDWAYWIIAITMGLSSGYFSSLGMIYAPRTVEPQYAATAGMFGAACLITGIFSGILFSFVWPVFVEYVPGF
ncbi:Equilibrative nucleoside transporter 2 [Carabus blaptoides fortunei]